MESVEAATVRAGEGELEREANVPSTEPQLSDAGTISAVNVGVAVAIVLPGPAAS
jgi:hypothetical protein